MSRSPWLLLLLFAAGSRTLCGQNLARLEARADSLLEEWRRANALADLLDSLAEARVPPGRDTIRVGALTIVANPSPLLLGRAAARAWSVIDSVYGTEARQLRERPYIIAAFDPDTTVERSIVRGAINVPWDADVASLTLMLLANVPIARPDASLQTWLDGSGVRPMRGGQQRASVYMQLVTAPSQTARNCLLGDVTSCRYALDLVDVADPLQRWYPSAEERRALVLTASAGYLSLGARQPAFQSCLSGSNSACTEFLRSLPPQALPRPLTYDARETLVHVALRLGAREAYRRLLSRPSAPIADRLAEAAGVSIDVLVSRWRAEILASRPVPVTLPRWGLWVALGWTVVFAACGMRSSRWRVS